LGGRSLLGRIPALASGLGLALVLASLLLALLSFAGRQYSSAPSISASIGLLTAPREWLEWRFLGTLERAVARNSARLKWKANILSGAMIVLASAVMILGGYALGEIAGGR